MSKNKRFKPKMHVKKGDRVFVISGEWKDLANAKEVLEVLPEKQRAVVDGINMVKKHLKPTNNDEGGIKEVPAAIHVSKLMLMDPKTGEPTRIGRKQVDGKNVRFSKKSGEILDK
jgi:large subunit ribosomal protein L24